MHRATNYLGYSGATLDLGEILIHIRERRLKRKATLEYGIEL